MKQLTFIKRGYRCAKGWEPKDFGLIHIDGDLHLCSGPDGDFVFNTEHETKKLYMGKPCVYTDTRFDTEKNLNSYHSTYVYYSRRKFDSLRRSSEWCKPNRTPRQWGKLPISLKACIRKIRKVKGIPKGTVIEFANHWYYPGSKNVPAYVYIHNGKDSEYEPNYQINEATFNNNFTEDVWAIELTDKLRAAGFLVQVYNENPGLIYGVSEGEMAVAYGFNKKIGFSTGNNDFRGYHIGCDHVLYDYYNCFDKWSKALIIKKTTPIDEIVRQLTEETGDRIYPDFDD
jgi:hypothetical protein